MKSSPWWFCTGWWSPWCLLDAIAHCKVPWICKKHDDAQERWLEDRYGKVDPSYDWAEDGRLGDDEVRTAVGVLPPVNVSTGTSATATFTESSGWTWTYR